MRSHDLGFFNYIERLFGVDAKINLKAWSRIRVAIVKTREKIFFLKECKRLKLLPQHLLSHPSFDISLNDRRSITSFNNLRRRTALCILNIELADAHRLLRHLRFSELRLVRYLSDLFPYNILNNFFTKQFRFFQYLSVRERHRFHKKLDWLVNKEQRKFTRTHSFDYYYRVLPQISVNNYKQKLRSNSNTASQIIPFSFSTSPFSSNTPSFKISISPPFSPPSPDSCIFSVNEKWFLNLSSIHIPTEVQCLLQLGEKFSLPNVRISQKNIFDFIKYVECGIKGMNPEASHYIRNHAIHLLTNYLSSPSRSTPLEKQILTAVKYTKNFLKDHPELIVTRADKGNTTVALDKNTYIDKMKFLLNDPDTYTVITKDPTRKIFNSLNVLLKRWKEKNYISTRTYRVLLHSDGVLPRAYGLPKIHKTDCPLRIIVSSVNSTLHGFATYLHNILHENLPKANSHISNSFELVNRLKNFYIDDQSNLISLDVVSLFTNVPTDLIIEGVAKRWQCIENKIDIPYFEFINGLKLVLDSTFFCFNGTFYKQIFGTPMGSPLSPICADIVLQDLEEKAIARLPFHLPFYFRYVDDIILTAPLNFTDLILNIFNSFHNRLQFTIEIAENNCLNFLDVSIIVNHNRLEFDWYHKPTFSGRFLNFFSQHPLTHKRGVIIGLTDRVFKLSHPRFHGGNFKSIIDILLNNGYPIKFIINTITNRVKCLIHNTNNSVPVSSPSSSSPSPSFFVIPFINYISNNFKNIVRDNN